MSHQLVQLRAQRVTRVVLRLGALLWIVQCGCATKGPSVRPPLPAPSATERVLVSPEGGAEDKAASRIAAVTPPLPGSGRVYPSQESANHPPPGAPEAFPLLPGESVAERAAPNRDELAPTRVNQDPVPEGYRPERGSTSGSSKLDSERSTKPAESQRDAAPRFTVQLFALSELGAAEARRNELAPFFSAPLALVEDDGLHKLRFEPTSVRAEAELWLETAHEMGFDDAFLLLLDGSSP